MKRNPESEASVMFVMIILYCLFLIFVFGGAFFGFGWSGVTHVAFLLACVYAGALAVEVLLLGGFRLYEELSKKTS